MKFGNKVYKIESVGTRITMARGRGIPIVSIRPLKRRSDGELVYASSGIPYKNGDRMQRYKHEAQVILRNSIYGD